MKTHTLKITDGDVQFVYADDIKDLMDVGVATNRRASEVEPASGYCRICHGKLDEPSDGMPHEPGDPARWVADMKLSDGPVLDNCGAGFETREDALAAERDWLRLEHGL